MSIQLINVDKYYLKNNPQKVLKNIDLTINTGDLILVAGESGSGKSTLLNILTLYDETTKGQYIFNGINTNKLSSSQKEQLQAQYMTSIATNTHFISSLTAYENLKLLENINKLNISKLLNKVGLKGNKHTKYKNLSKGQQSILALAKVLIEDSFFIVLDEPFANLDEDSITRYISLLNEIRNNKIIIIVSHQENAIKPFINKRLFIENQQIFTQDFNQSIINEAPTITKQNFNKINIKVFFNLIRKYLLKLFFLLTFFNVLLVLFLILIPAIYNTNLINKEAYDSRIIGLSFNHLAENRLIIMRKDLKNFDSLDHTYFRQLPTTYQYSFLDRRQTLTQDKKELTIYKNDSALMLNPLFISGPDHIALDEVIISDNLLLRINEIIEVVVEGVKKEFRVVGYYADQASTVYYNHEFLSSFNDASNYGTIIFATRIEAIKFLVNFDNNNYRVIHATYEAEGNVFTQVLKAFLVLSISILVLVVLMMIYRCIRQFFKRIITHYHQFVFLKYKILKLVIICNVFLVVMIGVSYYLAYSFVRLLSTERIRFYNTLQAANPILTTSIILISILLVLAINDYLLYHKLKKSAFDILEENI